MRRSKEAETQAREAKMLDDLLNLPPFDLKDLPEPALDDLLKDLLILPELPELRYRAGAEAIRSMAFSPDGTTLALGLRDGTVKLWDVATTQDIATLRHSTEVESVALSADGTTLALGSLDGTVLLWDMSALGLGVSSQATFSLSLDGDGAAGDQAITSLDVSPGSVVSIQVFGKDIQDAIGVSVRFEYDAAQVLYEGFDPGGVLPDAQVLSVPDTNSTSTAIEISMAAFEGQPAADSGLVGSIRFRTTGAFSGTTLRLVRAELGRGEQREV